MSAILKSHGSPSWLHTASFLATPPSHTAVRRSHRPRRMAVANTEFYPAFSPPPTRVQVAPLSLREPPALVLDGWRRYLSSHLRPMRDGCDGCMTAILLAILRPADGWDARWLHWLVRSQDSACLGARSG